jgi:F420-dependent oxidoreductase-like protein
MNSAREARMKIGLFLGDTKSVDDVVAQARRAEADGFASVWLPHVFGMDALMAAAFAGRETSRIEVGTSVVPTYPRHPVTMAQQALSAQAATGNRLALGIGLSHQVVIEGMFGLSFAKPYTHMKEYLAVLAPLIRAGKVSCDGGEFRVHAKVAVPGANPCPILLAALAPRMLALAGREGDGTVTWMTGPKTLREYTVPRINEAAAKAGRPAPRVVVALPVAITDDVAATREAAARFFQVYGGLPSYRAMLDREGATGPADLVIVGDEDGVGEQIQRIKELGASDFVAVPYAAKPRPEAALERTRAFLIGLLPD